MIINLRGNNSSGKTTIIRNILTKFKATPIYGLLGPAYPEAHRFELNGASSYALGPYRNQSHGGCDVVTKKGAKIFIELLEKYVDKGSIVFESILTSIRFMEPTIGKCLLSHKKEMVIVVLDVSLEDCLKSLHLRQEGSEFSGGEKHVRRNHIDFERVTVRFKNLGFRIEYVTRESGEREILRLLREKL